jgi:hypothetical protein
MPKELYLLGLGVKPSDHATVEVLQAAGLCASVYAQGLDAGQERFLRRFCAPGALKSLPRAADEEALAGRLVKEASRGRRVALATLGHPFYWSGAAGRLIAACARAEVPWRTFGSVSPMGVAIAELGVTLGTTIYGLQSFDYAALASRAVAVNKGWPLVVYFYSPLSRTAYASALDVLGAVYPAGHAVHWCGAPGKPRALTLGALRRLYGELSAATVLYLPALESPRTRAGRTEHHSMKRRREASSWVKD